MVNISIVYNGDLHCHATHGPSGQNIITDAPVDNGGKGEYFSPTDLVATGFGACIATVIAKVAERDGLNVKGMKVDVIKEMTSNPKRRIGKLTARIIFPVKLTDSEKKKLEKVAQTCPVGASLHPDIELIMDFVYC